MARLLISQGWLYSFWNGELKANPPALKAAAKLRYRIYKEAEADEYTESTWDER